MDHELRPLAHVLCRVHTLVIKALLANWQNCQQSEKYFAEIRGFKEKGLIPPDVALPGSSPSRSVQSKVILSLNQYSGLL